MASYLVSELDPRSADSSEVWINDVNGQGVVVGLVGSSGQLSQPAMWTQPGLASLVNAPASSAVSYGINDSADVVGDYSTGAGSGQGFVNRGGFVTDLASILSAATSSAQDINNAGVVVGGFGPDAGLPGALRVFRYDAEHGLMDDLGRPPGAVAAIAVAVSDSGLIAGQFFDGEGNTHGWTYRQGFTELGVTRPGSEGPLLVADVNDHGRLVGTMPLAGQNFMAYSLDTTNPQAEPSPLGGLPDYPASCALGLNEAGAVVGYCFQGSAEYAFVADAEGLRDLNDAVDAGLGWVLNRATAINDQGQIAGYGKLVGQQRGFLLTPMQSPVNHRQLPALVAAILFGVVYDGGGLIEVGGVPIPVPPMGWAQLFPSQQNLLIGVAISQLSTLIPDTTAQHELNRTGIDMIARAAAALNSGSR